MKTQYIILDFEMNPVAKQNKEARSRLHREIIEIGAVKLDSNHNIVDKFSCYVKPRCKWTQKHKSLHLQDNNGE